VAFYFINNILSTSTVHKERWQINTNFNKCCGANLGVEIQEQQNRQFSAANVKEQCNVRSWKGEKKITACFGSTHSSV